MTMQEAQDVRDATPAIDEPRFLLDGRISRVISHGVLLAVPVMLVIGIVVAILPKH
ncbi:hypothetical protein VVD49_20645 [Uliginosibacterium sp. H3]|uniref:ABC transporter permease n=1 Tax=Uliginosibacterium silvisoli TaxID=3114758 RepID=A0ABU6KB30_9RHOO|nr:hypothetical protein [Uliginosibacterium sp. H3]